MAQNSGSGTRFASLTDMEFLRQISDDNLRSPIIIELKKRFERAMALDLIEGSPTDVKCPACEAELRIKFNEEQRQFKLHISQ